MHPLRCLMDPRVKPAGDEEEKGTPGPSLVRDDEGDGQESGRTFVG